MDSYNVTASAYSLPSYLQETTQYIGSDDKTRHSVEIQEQQQLLKSPLNRVTFLSRIKRRRKAPLSPNPYRSWRRSVTAAAVVTAFVLVINVVFAIVAGLRSTHRNETGVLFEGQCSRVKRWNTAIHLLINILGTALLSASSYCMQTLSSPTRSETDRAHARGKSLEIGVSSFFNARHMQWWKGCLFWTLCLSTLPLHLLWNSTVFSTIGAMRFSYLVVDEGFLSGAPYVKPNITDAPVSILSAGDITDPAVFLKGYQDGSYVRLSTEQCLREYTATFLSSYRNLIAVTTSNANSRLSPSYFFPTGLVNITTWYGEGSSSEPSGYPSIDFGYPEPLANGSSVLALQGSGQNGGRSPSWSCYGWEIFGQRETYNVECSQSDALRHLRENGTWYLRPTDIGSVARSATEAYAIDYCLAESVATETCQLSYVPFILTIVIVCNVIKLAAMCLTAYMLWDINEPIFATVGDAIASFMERPDPYTSGQCLMDMRSVKAWSRHRKASGDEQTSKVYDRTPTAHVYSTTTKTRWWTTMSLCSIYLGVGLSLLGLGMQTAKNANNSSMTLWQRYGLGVVTTDNILGLDIASADQSLIASILVANSFQLVLSMTYFLLNSLWTAQCAAKEWASYAKHRMPLRVTWPRGQQRSTYYLSLPYKYALPLIAMLATLHFTISQSIFLARVQWYRPDGVLNENDYLSDAGFSPLGILITVLLAFVLLFAQVVHCWTKIDNRIPMHGNSSVVISAACHIGPQHYVDDDGVAREHPKDSMAQGKVMWGVTRAEDGLRFRDEIPSVDDEAGHCSFTANDADPPVMGLRYR